MSLPRKIEVVVVVPDASGESKSYAGTLAEVVPPQVERTDAACICHHQNSPSVCDTPTLSPLSGFCYVCAHYGHCHGFPR